MFKFITNFVAKRKADQARAVVDAYADAITPMALGHVPVLIGLYQQSAHQLIDAAAANPELMLRATQVAKELRAVFKPVFDRIFDDLLVASEAMEDSLELHAPLIKRLGAAVDAFNAE